MPEGRVYSVYPLLSFIAESDEDAQRQILAAQKALDELGVSTHLDEEMYRDNDSGEDERWEFPADALDDHGPPAAGRERAPGGGS